MTAQDRVTVSYTGNSTRSHDCHDSFSLTVEFKTTVQLRCSNAGLTRDSFTLRVFSQDSCTVHFKLVTFTRTDAAHLSRTLEALRCSGLTPRFHSYPSLAVTGIGSCSRSQLSTKFALYLFAVSSLVVTLITSGSVFRADVEACRRPFRRFCCFQLISHTRLLSTSSLLTFGRFPIRFVQLFFRVCLERHRVL